MIASAGWGLVYGGGRVGLMGLVADAAIAAGGEVIGVIPGFLNRREILHPGLTQCHAVESLLERKALMIELSTAFLALPGGLGTFDELLEVMAWRQLGQLDKAIGVLDAGGYFKPFLSMLTSAIEGGFLEQEELDRLTRIPSTASFPKFLETLA
jgi:uncharacterized protein (TIGR00730 family)